VSSVCAIHPHGSEYTAEKCWAKRAGKRADRVIERSGTLGGTRYVQVKHSPPKEEMKGKIQIFWFFEGV
jgi:hypothetical protein